MSFEPGTSGNKRGRPKGATGKVTSIAKELLNSLLSKELEALPGRLEELDTKERIEVLIRLLPYGIPKLKALELSGEVEVREPDKMTLPDGTKIEI